MTTPTTIHGLLSRQAARYGQRRFLSFGETEISFAGMEALSCRAAAGLAGAKVGEKIHAARVQAVAAWLQGPGERAEAAG